MGFVNFGYGEWVEWVVWGVRRVVMAPSGTLTTESGGVGFGRAPWGVGGAVEELGGVWRWR